MAGMVLITPSSAVSNGTVSIGANGAVDLTSNGTYLNLQGIFSADYRSYRIYASTKQTLNGSLQAYLMNGSTTITGNYQYTNFTYFQTTFSTSTTGTGSTSFEVARTGVSYDGTCVFTIDITCPFVAEPTAGRSEHYNQYGGSVTNMGGAYTFHHSLSSSYDGLRFFGNNMTGRFQVYGLEE